MKLLGYKELAARWNTDEATLRVWRHRNKLPPPYETFGASPVWKESTIEALEDTNGHIRRNTETGEQSRTE